MVAGRENRRRVGVGDGTPDLVVVAQGGGGGGEGGYVAAGVLVPATAAGRAAARALYSRGLERRSFPWETGGRGGDGDGLGWVRGRGAAGLTGGSDRGKYGVVITGTGAAETADSFGAVGTSSRDVESW